MVKGKTRSRMFQYCRVVQSRGRLAGQCWNVKLFSNGGRAPHRAVTMQDEIVVLWCSFNPGIRHLPQRSQRTRRYNSVKMKHQTHLKDDRSYYLYVRVMPESSIKTLCFLCGDCFLWVNKYGQSRRITFPSTLTFNFHFHLSLFTFNLSLLAIIVRRGAASLRGKPYRPPTAAPGCLPCEKRTGRWGYFL